MKTFMHRASQYAVRHPLLSVGFGLVLAAVIVQFARILQRPYGDFQNHWEWGRRFANGVFLYTDGLNTPYPPFWGMVHAPLSVLPAHTAQILIYPLSLLAVVLLFWVLHRLTVSVLPYSREQFITILLLTLFLSSRYWLRDLVECLPNLSLVALTWLAVYLWSIRREWMGGMCLGFAAALKCTPLLFLSYFVLKRQWKMAATSLLFTALFTIAPILKLGPGDYMRHVDKWTSGIVSGVSQKDPSYGVLGDAEYQNMSLRPTLARYLVVLPEGHRGRVDHPLYLDLFDLSPDLAGWLIWAIMGALLAYIAWKLRDPVCERTDESILWECAAISILILLYSPITWGQHAVGVIPACYLIARQWVQREEFPLWMKVALWIFVLFTLALNPKILGSDLTPVVESYHIETLGILALLTIVLGFHAQTHSRHKHRLDICPRQGALRVEDTVSRWQHPCDLRTPGLHRPAGHPDTETKGQPHPLPRRVCSQQPFAVIGRYNK
jgi:alpha-1,2-mannosyltransferase